MPAASRLPCSLLQLAAVIALPPYKVQCDEQSIFDSLCEKMFVFTSNFDRSDAGEKRGSESRDRTLLRDAAKHLM